MVEMQNNIKKINYRKRNHRKEKNILYAFSKPLIGDLLTNSIKMMDTYEI